MSCLILQIHDFFLCLLTRHSCALVILDPIEDLEILFSFARNHIFLLLTIVSFLFLDSFARKMYLFRNVREFPFPANGWRDGLPVFS